MQIFTGIKTKLLVLSLLTGFSHSIKAFDYFLVNSLPGSPYGNVTPVKADEFLSPAPYNIRMSTTGSSIAQSFETMTSIPNIYGNYYISDISVNLYKNGPGGTGSFTYSIGLYTNSPGSTPTQDTPNVLTGLVSEFATNFSSNALSTSETNILSFTNLNIPVISAVSTKYWIVATITNNSGSSDTLGFNYAAEASNTFFNGFDARFTSREGTFPFDTVTGNNPLLMSITVTPEPSTYVFSVLVTLTLGGLAKYRKKRVQPKQEVPDEND